MKKIIKTFINLAVLILLGASSAMAADGNIFSTIAGKVNSTLLDLQKIIYIIGGFGLIAFAFAAIFGKISFRHLSYLSFSLFLVAAMGPFVRYFSGDDNAMPGLDYHNNCAESDSDCNEPYIPPECEGPSCNTPDCPNCDPTPPGPTPPGCEGPDCDIPNIPDIPDDPDNPNNPNPNNRNKTNNPSNPSNPSNPNNPNNPLSDPMNTPKNMYANTIYSLNCSMKSHPNISESSIHIHLIIGSPKIIVWDR